MLTAGRRELEVWELTEARQPGIEIKFVKLYVALRRNRISNA